jgi:hypothetical protein
MSIWARNVKVCGRMWLTAGVAGTLAVAIAASASLAESPADTSSAAPLPRVRTTSEQFAQRVAAHQADTAQQALEQAKRERREIDKLSFDPTECQFFETIRTKLKLDDSRAKRFREQGLVVLPQNYNCNFGEAYYQIYDRDLPVLVTSDSILHVVHLSIDNTIKDVEEEALAPMLESLLAACHARLAEMQRAGDEPWIDSFRDVDLYLSVAQNLGRQSWQQADGRLAVTSRFDQDDKVVELLRLVDSLQLQRGPIGGEYTAIFGGHRPIDYSQFKPRGHYTQSEKLRGYFRTMMWLGRADCGFVVLGADPNAGLGIDGRRELRDAVILSEILSGPREAALLEKLNHTIELLAGESDNLRPAGLRKIMEQSQITWSDVRQNAAAEERLRQAIAKSPQVQQQIASQVYMGSEVPGEQIPPPALVQMLGQRFVIDSFVLANVVHDTVKGRLMPRGLDVVAALGNPTAIGLLDSDLRKWSYAPQLLALADVTKDYLSSPAGKRSVYDMWLAALASVQADGEPSTNFPEVMRTRAWHVKQLQTQLASWSELRHDLGILYAKQSYTRGECSYPAGFVEPYPALYERLAVLSQGVGASLAGLNGGRIWQMQAFWNHTTDMMRTLERLSRKELAGEPFTAEETSMLRKTIANKQSVDRDYDHSRDYGGWYCQLLYPQPAGIDKWHPTVSDVHTDPNGGEVLEVGVGRTDLIVVAVDNGADRMAFVGPIYAYYEFKQPGPDRMTDEEFARRLEGHDGRIGQPAWLSELAR